MQNIQILSLKQAVQKTGLCRSTLYNLVKTNDFPQPVRLARRRHGWVDQELDAWLLEQMGKRTLKNPDSIALAKRVEKQSASTTPTLI